MKGYKNYKEIAEMLEFKKDSQYNKQLNRLRSISYSYKYIKSDENPSKNYFLDADVEQIVYIFNNKFSTEYTKEELSEEELSEEEKFNGEYIVYNKFMKLKHCEYEILVKKYGEELVDTKLEQQQVYVKENPRKKYKNNYIALNNWCAKEKTQRELYEPINNDFPQEVNIITQNINGKEVLIFKDESNGITYIATEWVKI